MPRYQISTTVSQTTRQQAERLMEEREYSLRDVVSLGVQMLYDRHEQEWSDALKIVADCGRCGEPITAAEPEIYWDGERICQSCRDIALAAQGE